MTDIRNMVPTPVLEWVASVLGLSGAILFATNSALTKYGFILFMLSGMVFIVFSLRNKYWGLITMQFGFIAVDVVGIYNWML